MADLVIPIDVRCDLCERPGRPVVIFQSDAFVVYMNAIPVSRAVQNTEWAACRDCQDDVLSDRRASILARRRESAIIQLGGQTTPEQLEAAIAYALAVLSGFFVYRQPNFRKPFDSVAEAIATATVRDKGGRT